MLASLRTYSNFVKLEHTLFSLPLILAGSLIGEVTLVGSGAPGQLSWFRILMILIAGAGARTFALAANRIIDRKLDADNPRTLGRELPSGKMRLREAWAIALVGLAAYYAAIANLPVICLYLSPLPIAVFLTYPHMKRFTATCHFGVGLSLALSPVAGFVAVTGSLTAVQSVIPLAVFALFWVAGFDIIYATLDRDHDRAQGIHSLPAVLGKKGALRSSAALHLLAFLSLVLWCVMQGNGWLPWLILAAIGLLLIWEQRAADRVDLAFFRINSWLGFVVLALVWSGVTGGWRWTISP
jgi:4-hydroxybenzoate polyprenyltransferase